MHLAVLDVVVHPPFDAAAYLILDREKKKNPAGLSEWIVGIGPAHGISSIEFIHSVLYQRHLRPRSDVYF